MNRKRSSGGLPNLYASRKRICTGLLQPTQTSNDFPDCDIMRDLASTSDTKAALMLIKNHFPSKTFENRVPPIILQHQLYSIVKNRTQVDMEVEQLRNDGQVRLFKLGCETRDICIAFTSDFNAHLRKSVEGSKYQEVVEKFMKDVLPFCNDVNVNKDLIIEKYGFKDTDVTLLVNAGVLTVRDVGSWWLAIPGAGHFVRSFVKGRKAIVAMIKRCKYKEILLNVLQERKMPKSSVFSVTYLLHDIIGAELVTSVQTTSGILLRLKDD